MKNKENQESNGKRERRIILIIKRSKERSRSTDDQKRLRVKEKAKPVAEAELDWSGVWSVECGGCLRVRMKTEKCELWGM